MFTIFHNLYFNPSARDCHRHLTPFYLVLRNKKNTLKLQWSLVCVRPQTQHVHALAESLKNAARENSYQLHTVLTRRFNFTLPSTMTSMTAAQPENSAQSLPKPWSACRGEVKKKKRRRRRYSNRPSWSKVSSGPVWASPSFSTSKKLG